MERVYIYDGYFEKGIKGNNLIRTAAGLYLEESGENLNVNNRKIIRPENGKPYFQDLPVEFSLSHSGILWMCMMSRHQCGLDVQILKECDYEKLAERFFKKEELHFVRLWGQDGFFSLWVRKEAFVKCTGKGLFSEMPVLVDEKNDLLDIVQFENKKYYFKSLFISDDIKCAMCSTNQINEEVRLLQG